MERVMCPPTYFDVEYCINPWMDIHNPVDHGLAHEQWHNLVELLEGLGDTIYLVDAAAGQPDMTFAGDVGMVYGRIFVPSNFRHSERRGEVPHFERWFHEHEFEVRPLPGDVVFEGLGDVVFHGTTSFVGHGPRSDERAVAHLRELIPQLEVLGRLSIVDDRYFHLAMALAFIDEETVLYHPPAFSSESEATIRKTVRRPIVVGKEDANRYFACNNLVVDHKVILDACTPELRGALADVGYDVVTCGMSEFKKSGGSLRCLVLTFL
jgi:N-dimethylarginine dimethylaminohydrolase